jgi:hypothetical protein
MVALFTIFKRSDASRVYARVLTYYVLLGVTLAITVGLLAQVFVPLLAHQTFPLSAAIVLIIGLAQVACGLMHPVIIGPYVLERTSTVTPVFVSSAVLITIIGIGMVRLWGALGAAIALLLVYLIQALLLARLSQRLYRVQFERARVAKAVCALGMAFLLVRLVAAASAHTVIEWLLAPLFVAITIVALIVLRFPEPAEVSSLRAAVGRILRAE